jgi:TusA-related sulfurtransferase
METIDIRNTLIPFSLLQISNLFKQMRPGETLEIIVDETSTAADLERILSGSDFHLQFDPHWSDGGQGLCLRLMKKNG